MHTVHHCHSVMHNCRILYMCVHFTLFICMHASCTCIIVMYCAKNNICMVYRRNLCQGEMGLVIVHGEHDLLSEAV